MERGPKAVKWRSVVNDVAGPHGRGALDRVARVRGVAAIVAFVRGLGLWLAQSEL